MVQLAYNKMAIGKLLIDMKTLILSLFTLLLSVTAWQLEAAPKWQNLGAKTVSRSLDVDRIAVTNRGQFSKLQLGVTGTGVKIHKMIVHFKNGAKREVSVNRFIAKNERSRVIDLPGQSRAIKSVVIHYEAKGVAKKKARVTLWGRR